MMDQKKIVRIGCASGFWGDSMVAAPQLVAAGIDYLVFDYLAETTMVILAGMRAKNPDAGFATDFVDIAMKSVLTDVKARGIKVIANAGGINPRGCADALAKLAAEQGVALRIAVVEGDDVGPQYSALRDAGARDMFTGADLPPFVLSANAYFGALPVAQALAAGADVVITGRCVDSAVTVGALIHEFDWAADAYDQLAGASLAGHILECGCQGSGGLFTDWRDVPDWENSGYPIAECAEDGSFTVTKPAGTGGLIARAAVAEQLLYEIGDPGAYLLPDVSCDFRNVRLEQINREHVRVSGARGYAPAETYKVSATTLGKGFRSAGTMIIIGGDAVAKAQRTGEAIIARTRCVFERLGLDDYLSTHIEVIGGETTYGPHARAQASREVMMRVVVDHVDKRALDIFAREIAPSATSWAQGTTSPDASRPSSRPNVRQFSFIVPKTAFVPRVRIGDTATDVVIPLTTAGSKAADVPAAPPAYAFNDEPLVEVPLMRLAWGRSGDKGDLSNIGLIARRPEWLPLLWHAVTPEAVQHYFAHLIKGSVERYYVPGFDAMNLVLHAALDGGGPSSHRMDPLGKAMAQMLLDMPVKVPQSVAEATKLPG